MFKNKLINMMMVIILAITLAGVTAFVTVTKLTNATETEAKEPSIDEIVKASFDIPDITTNLLSNDIIRISFKVQTDSKKTKEEPEKRLFQVKNIIIQELSEMKSEDFQGKESIVILEDKIKGRTNELLSKGSVVQVYTTSKILQ